MTAARITVIVLPLLVGWLVSGYLQLRSVQHLRSASITDRVAAFVFGPLAGARFTLEGYRYRGLALAFFVGGLALTVLLAALLGQPR